MCDCLIPSLPLAVGVGVGGPTGSVKPERTRRSWTKREEEVLHCRQSRLHSPHTGGETGDVVGCKWWVMAMVFFDAISSV